jgi:hypothetical protein
MFRHEGLRPLPYGGRADECKAIKKEVDQKSIVGSLASIIFHFGGMATPLSIRPIQLHLRALGARFSYRSQRPSRSTTNIVLGGMGHSSPMQPKPWESNSTIRIVPTELDHLNIAGLAGSSLHVRPNPEIDPDA